MKKYILILLIFGALYGCNKTRRNSNRLDGERWKVTELSVDGVNVSVLPVLRFSECDIYDEDCTGTWYYGNSGHAKFIWQIRDNGRTLIISNQADHAHTMEDVQAAQQCIDFSGTYYVLYCKRKSFKAESMQTYAFAGKKVILKMERD